MNISGQLRRWVAGGICICVLGMFSSPGYSQDGEALDADSLLMNKKTNTQPDTQPPVQKVETADKNQDVLKEAEKEMEKALADAKAENENKEVLAEKIKLAKEMHNIRPTRVQVDSAIRQAAMNFPEEERVKFISAMGSMLNYNAIERISIDAMVETYSHKELESMVEYFSKPEAKTASKKIAPWAMKVQPEIVHMIDRAMMRLRTGQ